MTESRICAECGHVANDHEAGECWATFAGRQCDCSWFALKEALPDGCVDGHSPSRVGCSLGVDWP